MRAWPSALPLGRVRARAKVSCIQLDHASLYIYFPIYSPNIKIKCCTISFCIIFDSLHIAFPAHLFDKNSVVCIKKRLPNFCLSDLHLFEGEFQYTDFVFVSCGVNDLSRYNWNSDKLFSYFEKVIGVYRKKFPRNKFIIDSLLHTDFKWFNVEIEKFNFDVFNYTLQEGSNVWFFDSHHIADSMYRRGSQILETGSRRANGVHDHIAYPVTNEIRGVIAHCLNTWSA